MRESEAPLRGCFFMGEKIMLNQLLAVFLLLTFASCATNSKKGSDKLNKTKIEKNLVKGKTSKAQVVEVLGAPEMINSDSNGKEQWVYSQYTSQTDSSSVDIDTLMYGFSTIAYGGVGMGASNSKSQTQTVTLTVYFNSKGMLEHYKYSKSSI